MGSNIGTSFHVAIQVIFEVLFSLNTLSYLIGSYLSLHAHFGVIYKVPKNEQMQNLNIRFPKGVRSTNVFQL
jgi:hypothetical protein